MKKALKLPLVITLTLVVCFVVIKKFVNRPGDWGATPLSDRDIMYFLTTTASTVGYGDIGPKSPRAKNFTMFMQMALLSEVFAVLSQAASV